jgi:alpha-1,3/alpha-1,6-mannosyltransferase
LALAGGYDERLDSSVEYLAELKKLVTAEKMEDKVTFILSPSDSAKVYLLSRCKALIYTPSNEHFGIVPLEVSTNTNTKYP